MYTNSINMRSIQQLAAIQDEADAVRYLALVFGRFYSLVSQREQYRAHARTGFRTVEEVLIDPHELDSKVQMAENVAINTLKNFNKKATYNGLDEVLPDLESMCRKEIAACILIYVQNSVSYSKYASYMKLAG